MKKRAPSSSWARFLFQDTLFACIATCCAVGMKFNSSPAEGDSSRYETMWASRAPDDVVEPDARLAQDLSVAPVAAQFLQTYHDMKKEDPIAEFYFYNELSQDTRDRALPYAWEIIYDNIDGNMTGDFVLDARRMLDSAHIHNKKEILVGLPGRGDVPPRDYDITHIIHVEKLERMVKEFDGMTDALGVIMPVDYLISWNMGPTATSFAPKDPIKQMFPKRFSNSVRAGLGALRYSPDFLLTVNGHEAMHLYYMMHPAGRYKAKTKTPIAIEHSCDSVAIRYAHNKPYAIAVLLDHLASSDVEDHTLDQMIKNMQESSRNYWAVNEHTHPSDLQRFIHMCDDAHYTPETVTAALALTGPPRAPVVLRGFP